MIFATASHTGDNVEQTTAAVVESAGRPWIRWEVAALNSRSTRVALPSVILTRASVVICAVNLTWRLVALWLRRPFGSRDREDLVDDTCKLVSAPPAMKPM